MDCGSGGIGYQMRIAHGHSNGSMPHQTLDTVYVFAITRQPASKGMPKAVKYDSPGPIILLDAVIKTNGVCKCPERMGQVCAHFTAYDRRKDQAHRRFLLFAFAALLKNFQCSIVQGHFASRLAVRFITHGEHGMNQVHIRPFKALKLTKAQASVQREDNAVVQVLVWQLLGSAHQSFCLLGSQKNAHENF